MNRTMLCAVFLSGLALAGGGCKGATSEPPTSESAPKVEVRVPTFEIDASWPKVPEKWKLGNVASVAVDSHDHVWVLHRPRTLSAEDQAKAAPPVLEFDSDGTFIQAWGGAGRGFEWPQREHGIFVDHDDNVWIGGNNDKARKLPGLKPINDDQILKFTSAGKFVAQFGRTDKSAGDADTKNFHEPADIYLYPKTNEVFIADGYGNHRVIVLDAATGAFKRMWGAFGNVPQAPDPKAPAPAAAADEQHSGPQEFNTVHFVRVSNDDLVYVADRGNHRVQVFTLDGKYIAQKFFPAATAEALTARAIAFSPDPQQEFMYVGAQPEIFVLNRKTLEVLGTIATPNAHQFAIDSKGNIYTAETDESRSRKLAFKGMGTASPAGTK